MGTLPQLLEEDIERLNDALRQLLENSDASVALILDKGGFLITEVGDSRNYDATTIGALASGAYLANQTIAGLVKEENFDSVYQQGDKMSILTTNVDEHSLLLVVFRAEVGVGTVKYHAGPCREVIAATMQEAKERDPEAGIDLSVLNTVDTADFFKRRD